MRLSKPLALGFTLTEMLLVVAMITIISGVSMPLYLRFNNTNQLDAAESILVQDLYQAQSFSRNQSRDSGWGVAINGQVITLFAGSSYAARNTAFDVTYTVPSNVSLTGSSSIVYTKLYGLPTGGATFNMTSSGKTVAVVVNSKGMVEY